MKAFAFFLIFLCLAAPLRAATLDVAVASNFSQPLKEIARVFEERFNHRVRISVGSTGKLYTQILHGAPFAVFLAADQRRPRLAEENELAVRGNRFTYATGRLALYPARSDALLKKPDLLSRLSIANPKTAPYGVAAIETLKKLNVYQALKGKLVYGENIAQAYQFVATGNVEVGLIALSQVVGQDNKWIVPQSLYEPIAQDAVLLKDTPVARSFMDFLKSDPAQTIMRKFGYD